MTDIIERKARLTAAYMNTDLGVDDVRAFDPILIIVLVNIIIQVMKMMGWCGFTPQQALDSLKNPGIIGRTMLARATRKVLNEKLAGRPDLAELEVQIKKALVEMAKHADEVEVREMLASTNS